MPTTACAPASSMSVMTTLAPSRAKVAAHAAPIPDAPPVTIATLPSTWPIVSSPSVQPRYHACTISSTRAHVDTDTADPETSSAWTIWAGVIAVIFMCVFGFRSRPKTIRCGRARAHSAVAIVRAWLRTLEGYSRFRRRLVAGRELPLRNAHLRFSNLPSLRCLHRGSLGHDGGTARSRQCERLERACALHVGSCGFTTLRTRRVETRLSRTQRTGCQRSSAIGTGFSAGIARPMPSVPEKQASHHSLALS